jgi:hypothetical protein
LAARRRWNWSSVRSRRSEGETGWLHGHAPDEAIGAAVDAEDWDEERLGFQERFQGEAA